MVNRIAVKYTIEQRDFRQVQDDRDCTVELTVIKAASTDQTSHGVTTGYPGRQHLIGAILPRAVS